MTDFHHSTAPCRHVLPPHRLRIGIMEIIIGVNRRRRWLVEDKLRSVTETEQPDACFAERVWLATGKTDMRRGMNSLALQVQQKATWVTTLDAFCGTQ